MRNFYINLVCLMICGFVFSQSSTTVALSDPTINNQFGMPSFADEERQAELIAAIKNSEDLQWSKALISSEGELKEVIARYNPLNDEIEIKEGENFYQLLKADNLLITFESTGKKYQLKSYNGDDNQIYKSYFLVNTMNDTDYILKKESYEMVKTNKKTPYNSVRLNRRVLTKKNHFYLWHNNELFYLSTNRTLIRRNYPDYKKEIIKYTRKHKLNSKNEEDLVKLATYIKSLIV